ncbi:hypothetical protein GC173_17395 [bacterium]|nr:hypothetical protein [bacterium]
MVSRALHSAGFVATGEGSFKSAASACFATRGEPAGARHSASARRFPRFPADCQRARGQHHPGAIIYHRAIIFRDFPCCSKGALHTFASYGDAAHTGLAALRSLQALQLRSGFPPRSATQTAMSMLLGKRRSKKVIVFLCTGDTCRGAMAQGYMVHALAERGMKYVDVKTAGVMTVPGLIPTDEAVQVMKNANIDISKHRSCPLTRELIHKADLILGMTPFHVQTALRMSEEAKGKTYLLKEFAESDLKNYQITDPNGLTLEVYKRVYREMKLAIDKMLDKPFFQGDAPAPKPEPVPEEAPAKSTAKAGAKPTKAAPAAKPAAKAPAAAPAKAPAKAAPAPAKAAAPAKPVKKAK